MTLLLSTHRQNGGTVITYRHPDGSVTHVWVKDKGGRHG
jgi:hypothetical protein